MTANLELAKERGISKEDILQINAIHEQIERIIDKRCGMGFNTVVFKMITNCEYNLQRLWKFEPDDNYHTYAPRYKFLCNWCGRTFKCVETGAVITLGKDIYPKQYITFVNCAVDLGNEAYSRRIGNMEEVF